MAGLNFPRLQDLDVAGKTVLLRTDLNVPMQGGQVTDHTRILRILPTIHYLLKRKCRIVLLSHFGRPKGKIVPSLSLAPLVDALSEALDGRKVAFAVDCIGHAAREAVGRLKPGDIVLLENLRFHPEEEAGDEHFAHELASLGEVYVNDAFSASHRAHASITGIARYLPVAAGKLMEQEVTMVSSIFADPGKRVGAVIGGAKVSTKLALLQNMAKTMQTLVIGGAMANTFLHAQGHKVGKSLVEHDFVDTARNVLIYAQKSGCQVVLPVDVVVAEELTPHAACTIADANAIPADGMAVDIGPASVMYFADALSECDIVIWNGPLGAFETSPFDASTINLARCIASMTAKGRIRSIAGGGDTLAALSHSGLAGSFSYLSTGGGAFLEWLEGKPSPGVAALMNTKADGSAKAKVQG